jgi:outer membrane protein TolC
MRRLLPILLLLLLVGCTTERRLANLEQDVGVYLEQAGQSELPEEEPERLNLDKYRAYVLPSDGEHEVVALDLRRSLELAAAYSREYQTSKETLYNTALALRGVSHDWEWNPGNNLSALYSLEQDPSQATFSTDSKLTLSKRFLSGARLTASLALSTIRYFSGDKSVSMHTLASLTASQPLLGGSGALVNREGLTQAERNLIYALRVYVRAREQLLISIATRYYAVLNAADTLEIGKQNLASVKASLDRSEAMADAGRTDPFQVDQARQKVLTAEARVVTYEEAFRSAQDDLKMILGLPLEVDIQADPKDLQVLRDCELPKPPMSFEEALETALRDRLDFATVNDRLADAERAVEIAKDGMRARLDLNFQATAGSIRANKLEMPKFGDADYAIGATLDLPFDRLNETIALKRAMIALHAQQRAVDAARDNITNELRSSWRSLNSYGQTCAIQKVSVELSEKRVESTQLLFEGGRINIRELLDAQDDLDSARIALTQALVNHRISWLKLLYQLGQLPVSAENLWSEQLDMVEKK